MLSYNIQDIAKILDGKLIKNSGGSVVYLIIDSRKVLYPRESLFFALRGERNDGHFFLSTLYKNGVRNFIVEELPDIMENYPRANFVVVNNTLKALQQLATQHRNNINIPVIGVTGSNGKTIVKEWLYQVLSVDKYVIRNPKSFNSQVGVPLSVWQLHENAEVGIFEAGISCPDEMDQLQKIINPTIGVFTNIGDAHQENFTSTEQKIEEKLKLFTECKSIVYSSLNYELSKKIKEHYPSGKNIFTWGKNTDDTLRIIKSVSSQNSTTIYVVYNNKKGEFAIPFTDKASIENAMHTGSVLLCMGYSLQQTAERLYRLEPVAMRLEVKDGINGCTIINDSYNSDLESINIALDFLSSQNQHSKKLIVLSDIEQSGYTANELYYRVAGMIKQKGIDRLIGIGKEIGKRKKIFNLSGDFFESTDDFLKNYDFSKMKDMAVLLKGARSFQFEKISKRVQKQTHRTVFEIDLNAIEHNLDYFKKLLKPQTGVIAMLKASGYGSGTHEIANICQYNRVTMLAVAFPDEGVELRKSGITIPIIILNPEEDSFLSIIENNLEPQISSFSSLKKFGEIAEKQAGKPYPIHLKIDTGMHRSGFVESETDDLINSLLEQKFIKVKTIFSHLASSDEPEQDSFTHKQASTFEKISNKITTALGYKTKRHLLNSAGIERFPQYQYDYVRLGIGMYGISSVNKKLATVGSLYSSIVQIKKIPKGETIGYGRRGIAHKDTVIATVPIGYADGLRRILSNGVGKLWVNDTLAPIIGNVCMDMCMIDITDINTKEGDRVEIFGKNLPVSTLAKWMNTIPYEVLTGISARVKRTYHFE